MNAAQIRAIAAELPPLHAPTCPVTVEEWNRYGALLVSIGAPDFERKMIVRPDGAVFPWEGSIGDLMTDVIERTAARLHP